MEGDPCSWATEGGGLDKFSVGLALALPAALNWTSATTFSWLTAVGPTPYGLFGDGIS
jgi:hypothetical protein